MRPPAPVPHDEPPAARDWRMAPVMDDVPDAIADRGRPGRRRGVPIVGVDVDHALVGVAPASLAERGTDGPGAAPDLAAALGRPVSGQLVTAGGHVDPVQAAIARSADVAVAPRPAHRRRRARRANDRSRSANRARRPRIPGACDARSRRPRGIVRSSGIPSWRWRAPGCLPRARPIQRRRRLVIAGDPSGGASSSSRIRTWPDGSRGAGASMDRATGSGRRAR